MILYQYIGQMEKKKKLQQIPISEPDILKLSNIKNGDNPIIILFSLKQF